MQGSWTVLRKNCVNFLPGLAVFARESVTAFHTWRKIYRRGYAYGPVDYVEQAEVYTPDYWKRGHSQEKNFWIDKHLRDEVTQQELAQLTRYKIDLWRLAHGAGALFLLGGYALPLGFFWLANDSHTPSCFNRTAAEMQAWRHAQDLYRYRSIPTFLTDMRWFFDIYAYPWTPAYERAWDELHEKNDVRRSAATVRPASEMYERFLPFYHTRRKSMRHLARSMGLPTLPMGPRINVSMRVRDYWNLIWDEDYMVMTQNSNNNNDSGDNNNNTAGDALEAMSDEELYDYAWRRYMAPYDKQLSRDELLRRIRDYFTLLGDDFVKHGKAPHLVVVATYLMGYYHDPGYLEADIAELDKNDFAYMAHIGKDAFLRRLEFENGPLRDQVEAHTQQLLSERAARAKAEAAQAKIEA